MNKKALLIFGVVLALAFLIFSYLRKDAPRLHHIQGQTMGTIVYNVKYVGAQSENLDKEIAQELLDFNDALSTYITDSEISRLNKSGELTFESKYFLPVLKISKEVYENTNGAFDPTVGPLVKAWGFGPEKTIPELDSSQIDSIKGMVGFNQLLFNEKSISIPENFQIDFSAIAKGYAVDLVAEILEKKDIGNYLIEIGGEVRSKGINKVEKTWSLGIEDPRVTKYEQELLMIVRLKDLSLATSGNYRNYYVKDDIVYAHIINPKTGYNSEHNLLSASVFAPNCTIADAYATAFMVLGLDYSKEIAAANDLEVILIYRSEGGIKSYVSDGIKPFLEMNKAE